MWVIYTPFLHNQQQMYTFGVSRESFNTMANLRVSFVLNCCHYIQLQNIEEIEASNFNCDVINAAGQSGN